MDGVGVEPTFTESESIVLPLNEPPNYIYKYNWNIFVSQIFFWPPKDLNLNLKNRNLVCYPITPQGHFFSAGGSYNCLYELICILYPHQYHTRFGSIDIHQT